MTDIVTVRLKALTLLANFISLLDQFVQLLLTATAVAEVLVVKFPKN